MSNSKDNKNISHVDLKFAFKISLIPCILLLFKFNSFLKYINMNPTVYDFILYIFNDYFFICYIYTIFFLITMYKVLSDEHFNSYIFIRFKNRKSWFFKNIIFIFKAAAYFVGTLSIGCILLSISNFDISNAWSRYSIVFFKNNTVFFQNFNPLVIVIISIVKVFLYLCTFGIIFYTLISCSRNNVVSFLITTIIFGGNVAVNLSFIPILRQISLFYNAVLDLNNLSIFGIGFGLIYFVVVIILLYTIGNKIFEKIDLNWS